VGQIEKPIDTRTFIAQLRSYLSGTEPGATTGTP
jgi:hypothetical protein